MSKHRRMTGKKKPGKDGENAIAYSVQSVLGNLPHRLYNDVYFEDAAGHPFQIDHLVLTPMGLLVIETKHWSGLVYGQLQESQWSYVPRGKGMIKRFYNPVIQNEKHTVKLRSIFGDDSPITPCTVFSHPRGEQFITPKVPDQVFTRARFEAFLAKWRRQSPIMDTDQMEVWHQKIMDTRRTDEGMMGRQRHYAREMRRQRRARRGAIGYGH